MAHSSFLAKHATRKKHQTYRNTDRLCPQNYQRPYVCLKRTCACSLSPSLSLALFFLHTIVWVTQRVRDQLRNVS